VSSKRGREEEDDEKKGGRRRRRTKKKTEKWRRKIIRYQRGGRWRDRATPQVAMPWETRTAATARRRGKIGQERASRSLSERASERESEFMPQGRILRTAERAIG